MNTEKKYERALQRNLSEIDRLLSYRNAVNEKVRIDSTTFWPFFHYAYLAMYDCIFFHAMKILDQHKDAVSFWYLWRCKKENVENKLNQNNIPLDSLELLSDKLKHIRDKTHFHFDKKDVFNPKNVWKKADIRGEFFNNIMDNLRNVLIELYNEQFGVYYNESLYDGGDIQEIIKPSNENEGFI